MKTGQKNTVMHLSLLLKHIIFGVFATLNEDDIVELERDLKREIPSQFRSFLMTDTNGLHLFHHFSLYGIRKSYNRDLNATPEPFGLLEPNIYEKA